MPCPNSLKDIVNSHGICETCDEGYFPNNLRDECTHCQADEILTYENKCKKCQKGYIPSTNRKYCQPCQLNLISIGGNCEACQDPKKE